MAKGISTLIDKVMVGRSMRRWTRLAEAAPAMRLEDLRNWRSQARRLRRQLNRVIHIADSRLTLPLIGSNAFAKPMGSDWAYRPELWREQLDRPGAAAVGNAAAFGDEARVFHDCAVSELTFRQIRNTREEDIAPFGARMEVFRFDGSFLSLVVDLPEEGARGLTKRHLVRLDLIVELEKPLEIFARLNIKHGPNTEQVVRELDLAGNAATVEFDIAYTDLNEKRVERMWLDLIFEGPEMNQVILRDVALSRRLRADL